MVIISPMEWYIEEPMLVFFYHVLQYHFHITNQHTNIHLSKHNHYKYRFAQGKTVTIEKRPVFNNMDLQPPTFQLESKPDYMIRAGPNADEVLLNPYQRRQIIEFQKR